VTAPRCRLCRGLNLSPCCYRTHALEVLRRGGVVRILVAPLWWALWLVSWPVAIVCALIEEALTYERTKGGATDFAILCGWWKREWSEPDTHRNAGREFRRAEDETCAACGGSELSEEWDDGEPARLKPCQECKGGAK